MKIHYISNGFISFIIVVDVIGVFGEQAKKTEVRLAKALELYAHFLEYELSLSGLF